MIRHRRMKCLLINKSWFSFSRFEFSLTTQSSCPLARSHNIFVHVSSNSKHEYGFKKQIWRSKRKGTPNACPWRYHRIMIMNRSFCCSGISFMSQLHINPCKQVQYKKVFTNLLKLFSLFLVLLLSDVYQHHNKSPVGLISKAITNVGVCPLRSIHMSSVLAAWGRDQKRKHVLSSLSYNDVELCGHSYISN